MAGCWKVFVSFLLSRLTKKMKQNSFCGKVCRSCIGGLRSEARHFSVHSESWWILLRVAATGELGKHGKLHGPRGQECLGAAASPDGRESES